MKFTAIQNFRRKLKAGDPVFGLWITLEAPTFTEMAVGLGLDWVVVDAEHGHLDWKEVTEHLRAAVRSNTVALVRLAEANAGLVKRALDCGADGVLIPWVESAEQLKDIVSMAQYPPEGRRGIGAERATAWGQCLLDHSRDANDHVLIVPILETVTAARHVRELAKVPGVDVFFFGPADFSSSAGYRGQWEGPGVAEQLLAMKDVLRQAGKHCGVMTTSDRNALDRVQQGFQVLGLGSDCGLFLRSLHSMLAAVGRDRDFATSLTPEKPIRSDAGAAPGKAAAPARSRAKQSGKR